MNIYEAERALSFVDASDRELWVRMGAALKTEFGEEGKNTWINWSQQDKSFNIKDANATWKSLEPGHITIASLIYVAKRYGYQPSKNDERLRLNTQELAKRKAERKIAEQQAIIERMNEAQEAKGKAQDLFAKGHAASPNHPYLMSKGITDPESLKSIKQLGKNLLIPAYQNKELVAVQKINPDGGKYFGKGEQLRGSSLFIGRWSEAKEKGLLMAEGFATAASLHKATGQPVMVTFNAHNMVAMAERLKGQEIDITLCADNDSHKKGAGLMYAQKAAQMLGERAKVVLPEFTQKDIATYQAMHGAGKYPTDFNDLHALRGLQAITSTLNHQVELTQEPSPQSPNQGVTTMTPNHTTPMQEAPAQRPSQQQSVEPTPPTPDPQRQTLPQVEKEENRIFFDFEQSRVRTPQDQQPSEEKQGTPTLADFLDKKYILDHNYPRPPEGLKDRYYASGEYYFYVHTNTSIFMDKGDKLTTAKSDMQTVHDMIEVAKEKGWDNIKLKGSKEFKRLTFLEAESQGISTRGYSPTKEDLAILEHLRTSRALNKIESTTIQTPKQEVPTKQEKTLAEQADKEASALVANNEIPTVGQINESRIADTQEFVSTQEIGGAEISPDVQAMANRLRDAGKHLNPQDMEKLKQHIKTAIVITHGMQSEFKAHALRNFEENISKSIQGNKLNIANPLKPSAQAKNRHEMKQEKDPIMTM